MILADRLWKHREPCLTCLVQRSPGVVPVDAGRRYNHQGSDIGLNLKQLFCVLRPVGDHVDQEIGAPSQHPGERVGSLPVDGREASAAMEQVHRRMPEAPMS